MNRIAAKRAFVTAEMLQGGDFDREEKLLASLARVQTELGSWQVAEVDRFIRDRDSRRFEHFQRATWRLDRIDLDRCVVWWQGGMGQLGNWATGKLLEVADKFKLKQPKESPVWNMQKFAELFSWQLPLIVFVVDPWTFAIDDGCHRAVAMTLAGVTSSNAWIGTLP
ncbi:MAG: hypothetical protein C5B58_02380 [Acidobacteria bacterium]|nr:MAG: hypothetical protein C5B58_02380 [Acidobacteriota bacterium]